MFRAPDRKRLLSGAWNVAKYAGGVLVAIASVQLVIVQLQDSRRQAQVQFLEERSLDFLQYEFANRAQMACLYDWWFAEDSAQAVGERCAPVTGDLPSYAQAMLYIEESYLYFVDEAKAACENGLGFTNELEIWKRDFAEDVSGAFGYYLVTRFADPEMQHYYAAARLPAATAQERVDLFLKMARLPDISAASACEGARRFRALLAVPVDEPEHVAELCGAPGAEPAYDDGAFDARDYCPDVHGIRPRGFFGSFRPL